MRARLGGLFTLLMLVVLGFVTLLPYWLLVRRLAWEDREALGQKLEAVREALAVYPAHTGQLDAEVRQDLGSLHFRLFYVRVLDEEQGTLVASAGISSVLPPSAIPPLDSGGRVGPSEHRLTARGRSYLYRTVRVTAGAPRAVPYLVQVVMDVTPERALADHYRTLSLAIFLAALLVSAGGAVAMVTWGLRPLAEITDTAARIGPHHLHERLGRRRWPAELANLAAVFDGMLDRLDESFDRLSRFSADLAHELRTPLTNMMTEMEVTLARARSPERYERVLGSALEESAHLSHIVETLLFLARAESGAAAVRREPVDARGEIERVADFYRPLAEQQGVSIVCRGGGRVNADPALLRRALGNLLSNALEHTPSGGRVVLSADPGASGMHIRVEDTGTGIPAEHLPHVFDRFYRHVTDGSPTGTGAGLGLSMVQSIAVLHGGDVSIQSQEGAGTTVVLSLPERSPTPV